MKAPRDVTYRPPALTFQNVLADATPPRAKWAQWEVVGRRFFIDGREVTEDAAQAASDVIESVRASA